jgi:uncharacterized membrane protein
MVSEMGTSVGRASTTNAHSRWWYGIATVPVVAFTAFVLAVVFKATEAYIQSNGFALAGHVAGAFGILIVVIVSFFIVPLFTVSLLMDVRKIRREEGGWKPGVQYYVLAVISLATFFTTHCPFMSYFRHL